MVFDDSEGGGGYIQHKSTGARTPLRKSRGVYEFDVWIRVPEKSKDSAGTSFRRQG